MPWKLHLPRAGCLTLAKLRGVFPLVTEEAPQLLLQSLLVFVVLAAAFVGEVWVPRVGVQRVELVHVVVGPGEKVDRLALEIGGHGATA